MINTIRYLLDSAVLKKPNKVALKFNKKELTFLELRRKVDSIASYLKTLNLKEGSRIAIYSNKNLEQVISVLAILSTDHILVPISNLLKKDQVKFIIEDCKVDVVITDNYMIENLTDINFQGDIIPFNFSNKNDISFEKIYERKTTLNMQEISSSRSAAIIYSSGSTGFPKGIVSSHRNLFDGAKIVSSYLNLKENDIISGILTFNFDYGLNQIYCMLNTTCTLVLHNFLFPADFYKHLVEDKITILPLMPVFLSKIFDEKMMPNIDIESLKNIRLICSSGGKVTDYMLSNIQKNFKESKFYSMYGLTEAFRSTYLPPEELKRRPNSIGKAIPDVRLYVINEEGAECEPNEIGELIHRGGCIGKGYWNRPEDTKKRFKSIEILKKVINNQGNLLDEVVVCSGDYVYKDEDGFIYFVSRKDEMIKSSGYRISPFEIESNVYKYIKEIKECAIFSIENDKIGQEIVLAYTADEEIVDSKIQNILKKYIANYMIPTKFFYMQEMPITTANQGKINKPLIKEKFLSEIK